MPNIDLDDLRPRAAIDDLLDRNDDRGGLGRLIPLVALRRPRGGGRRDATAIATILLEGRRGERDGSCELVAVAANETRSGATARTPPRSTAATTSRSSRASGRGTRAF